MSVERLRVTPEPELRSDPGTGKTERELLEHLDRVEQRPVDLYRTAAVEVAAGLLSRSLAMCELTPESRLTRSVTPDYLALVGRDLIERGESIHLIEVADGRVLLTAASAFDVTGRSDPRTWTYRLDIPGPSVVRTVTVAAESVIHVRVNVDRRRPWRGRSAVDGAKATAQLRGESEQSLTKESRVPIARVAPYPGIDGEEIQGYKRKLRAGGILTPSSGRQPRFDGPGTAQESASTWKPQRMGPEPAETLEALRSTAGRELLTALGVPVELYEKADGTGAREAFRRYVLATVDPTAAVIASELAAKLEVPDLQLSTSRLFGADVVSRARALKGMVESGVSLDDALKAVGLLEGR